MIAFLTSRPTQRFGVTLPPSLLARALLPGDPA